MATGSLFLGIDSSGGVDSDMEFIPCRNRFLMYKKCLSDTLRKREGKFENNCNIIFKGKSFVRTLI